MKLAIGSDERTYVTDAVVVELHRLGHEVSLFGALSVAETTAVANDAAAYWPTVARQVAEAVANDTAAEGILFCWTGTGVTIAANKVPGIRAALCDDAETARGARLWNNANLLCLSLRRTSEATAKEIITAWFATAYVPNHIDNTCLRQIDDLEADYLAPRPAA